MGTIRIVIILIGVVIALIGTGYSNGTTKTGLVIYGAGMAMILSIFVSSPSDFPKKELLRLNSEPESEIDEPTEQDGLSEKIHQAIDDGYTVYVDCKKVDKEAVNFNFKTYNIEINDKTKTVYLEKISGNVAN